MKLAAWHASWGVNIWMPKGKSLTVDQMLGKSRSNKDQMVQEMIEYTKNTEGQLIKKDKDGNIVKQPSGTRKVMMSIEDFKNPVDLKEKMELWKKQKKEDSVDQGGQS